MSVILFEFFPIAPPSLPITRLLFGFLVLCVFPLFLTLMNDNSLGLDIFVHNHTAAVLKKDIHCEDDFVTLSVVLNHHNQHVETYHRHYQCLELWAMNYIEQPRLPFNLKPQIKLVKFSYKDIRKAYKDWLIITNILFRKPLIKLVASVLAWNI